MEIPEHIKKSWIASKLYPLMKPKVATAKFHNKLNEVGYAKLTDEEISKIKELLNKNLLI